MYFSALMEVNMTSRDLDKSSPLSVAASFHSPQCVGQTNCCWTVYKHRRYDKYFQKSFWILRVSEWANRYYLSRKCPVSMETRQGAAPANTILCSSPCPFRFVEDVQCATVTWHTTGTCSLCVRDGQTYHTLWQLLCRQGDSVRDTFTVFCQFPLRESCLRCMAL